MTKSVGRPKIELENIEWDGWKALNALILWTNEEYCAEQLDMSVDTLVRRIQEKHGCNFAEYKRKRFEAIKINLRKKQYDTAMEGNTTMLIWLGKNLLEQTDKQEVSNPEGKSFKLSYDRNK